jgi:hypothetical protein
LPVAKRDGRRGLSVSARALFFFNEPKRIRLIHNFPPNGADKFAGLKWGLSRIKKDSAPAEDGLIFVAGLR